MSTTITAGPRRRGMRRLGAIAALGTALALVPAVPTEAATTTRIDVTVAEPLPPVTDPTDPGFPSGSIVSDTGLNCVPGTVATTSVSSSTRGQVTRFSGTKEFDCGADGTLSISFRARVRGCAASNFGVWRVVGGTGSFADARGAGILVGTYTGGDACTATGVDDRYRGVIRS